MKYVDLGLAIDNIDKTALLNAVEKNVLEHKKTFISTPYSEFLYRSFKNPEILSFLNQADFAVPDGIGIFIAKKFLSIPITLTSYYGKLIESFFWILYTCIAALFYPRFVKNEFKEKIPGSNLIWDIANLAIKHNKSIYLLGGFNNTPKLVAEKLAAWSSGKIKIAGYSNKYPEDPRVIEDIKASKADILLIAYGPITQEEWIVSHKEKLPCSLYIGLGGTFDYIAGTKSQPPQFIRNAGLEWFWRLLTQPNPKRIKRIWQATFGLIYQLVLFKVQRSLPYRKNVVPVILNSKKEVLVGLRKPEPHDPKDEEHWQFPQGGLDPHENTVEGAKREAREEMGITSLLYIKTSGKKNTYEWELGFSHFFRGQEQELVYFSFTGKDSEIQCINPPFLQEFTQYKWVPIQNLVETVHTRRKPLAKIIQSDLT